MYPHFSPLRSERQGKHDLNLYEAGRNDEKKPAGTQLFKATIAGWNGTLVRTLNGHSHEEDVAPAGTYANQVVGQ